MRDAAIKHGAYGAVISKHWSEGGKGASELADKVIEASSSKSDFRFLYDLNNSIEDKITKIVTEMYGAEKVELTPTAKEKIKHFYEQVFVF